LKQWVIIVAFIVVAAATVEETETALHSNEVSTGGKARSAISAWESYIAAVRAGDREEAKKYWSREARRPEYRVFDWQMPDFEKAVDLVRDNNLEIAEVEEYEDHVRLLVDSPKKEYVYYVIQKEGEAFLANPVEVLTMGWQTEETRHFVCHFENGEGPTSDEIRNLDEFYSGTSSYLDINVDRKIDYYKCSSREEVGELFGLGPATGRAYYLNHAVAATKWTSFHEVVHVILGQTCGKQPTSLILEGAACYFGGTSLVTREAQLTWAKTLVDRDESMPISSIISEQGFWSAEDMNDPYAEAAAFVGFLVVNQGIGKFKELYRYRDATEDVESAMERIYGKDIAQLEDEWRQWLQQLDVPTVGLGANDTANEIFRMEDPAYDDTGDGDYSYPLASGYSPGMFDLTEFRVLEDGERVYFELTYRNLVEWGESSDWGFGGTYTRIAIDCGGDGKNDFGRDAHATLSGNRDYLINVSDCGVLVWQGGRVAALLKRSPADNKLGDSGSECIRFSIPSTGTEGARKNWLYTVAVGGCSKRGKHLRDGVGDFLDVGRSPSEDTGGGGTDTAINPNVYDILLPRGQNQEKILGGYSTETEMLVSLPMVGQ